MALKAPLLGCLAEPPLRWSGFVPCSSPWTRSSLRRLSWTRHWLEAADKRLAQAPCLWPALPSLS